MCADDLIRAIGSLLPGARLCVAAEREWHSLISGTQICLSATLTGADNARKASAFSEHIGEHEFNLKNGFVDNIAVVESKAGEGETRLTISALVLDD